MTSTKRAIAYARRYPGQSAAQIANALKLKWSTVSSILYKAFRRDELVRKPQGGPAGGFTYWP